MLNGQFLIIGAFHHFWSPNTARLGLKGQSMVFTSSELGAGELMDHNQNRRRSTVWCKRTFTCISLQSFSLSLPRYADFSFSSQSNSMRLDQPTIADHYHFLANGSQFKPVSIVSQSQNRWNYKTILATIKVVVYDTLHCKYHCQNPLFFFQCFSVKDVASIWIEGIVYWALLDAELTNIQQQLHLNLMQPRNHQVFSFNKHWCCCLSIITFCFAFVFKIRCNYTIFHCVRSKSVRFLNQAKHCWLPPSWVD